MASGIMDSRGARVPTMPDGLRGPVYSSVSLLRSAEIMAFGPVTTGELARALDCHIRTARRALERLLAEGWATRTQGARPRYSLTLRAVAMGAQAWSLEPFARVAVRLVDEVAARAARQAFVAVPCYERLLCVACSDRAGISPGDLLDAPCSAAGRVLLASNGACGETRERGYLRVGDTVALALSSGADPAAGVLTVLHVGEHEQAVIELTQLIVRASDRRSGAPRRGDSAGAIAG
jgi:DNA-binding MarR family transcriptional regulator